MKQSPLRSDPAKVREFVERNRQSLERTAELRRETPLRSATGFGAMDLAAATGREGMRSSALRRSVVPAAQRKRAEGPDPAQQPRQPAARAAKAPESIADAVSARFTPFRPRRSARDLTCERCKRASAAHWHHWLAQTHLRTLMRTLAVHAAWTPRETQRRLRVWLRDERNLEALCGRCHEDGEATITRRFRQHEVRRSACVFAGELDDELEAAGVHRAAVVKLSGAYS